MKKIILFLATVLAISACCESEIQSTPTKHKVDILPIVGFGTHTIRKFEYENHEYIIFIGSNNIDIEHDPNCSCHKENLW